MRGPPPSWLRHLLHLLSRPVLQRRLRRSILSLVPSARRLPAATAALRDLRGSRRVRHHRASTSRGVYHPPAAPPLGAQTMVGTCRCRRVAGLSLRGVQRVSALTSAARRGAGRSHIGNGVSRWAHTANGAPTHAVAGAHSASVSSRSAVTSVPCALDLAPTVTQIVNLIPVKRAFCYLLPYGSLFG